MAGIKYCPCIVHSLIRDGNFELKNFGEKKNIVNAGRPIPDMSKLRTFVVRQSQSYKGPAVQLNFDKMYYIKHSWLTGCDMASQLFCWPCVIFKTESQTKWATTGWIDLIKLERACTTHEKTGMHIKASIQLEELKQQIKTRDSYIQNNETEGSYKEIMDVRANNESEEKVTNTCIENNKSRCRNTEFNSWAVDSSDEYSSECSSNSIPNSHKSRKRLSTGFKTINKLVNKLKKISDESEQENEFDVYCKCLAVQLKKMPLQQALLCQQKIQNAMTAERLDLNRLEQSQA